MSTFGRNPVKRGLVEQPDQWVWRSFRSYAYGKEGIGTSEFSGGVEDNNKDTSKIYGFDSRVLTPLNRKERD
jgi:hypothetical protein